MQTNNSNSSTGILYEPDSKLSVSVSLGLGLQLMVVGLSVTILLSMVVFRAGGVSEAYLIWGVFAAIVVTGLTTVMQSMRIGRFGMGHILLMGTSGTYIAVCIDALNSGGGSMLGILVLVSGLVQLAISQKLSLFRKILTPTVSGTVLMLIPISVMSAVFNLLEDVPANQHSLAAPLVAFVTAAVMCGVYLVARGILRLWASILGVVAGTLVAGAYGLYDISRIMEASWVGLPELGWPGLDIHFGPAFWVLLPGFILAATISSIRTMSSAVAVQRVSWRTPRAVDYRLVQGAVATDGISNMFSGLLGAVPNTAYSLGASLSQLTGVASRHVGIAAGLLSLVLAFLPKVIAMVLAIPGPVFGAYLIVMMAMLFMIGVQMIVQDGLDYQKSLIAGVSFWLGLGFQSRLIFPDVASEFAGGLLNNGMTAGGIIAILMTLFMKMAESRPKRLSVELDLSALTPLMTFLDEFATRQKWGQQMKDRLNAVGEEVFVTLLDQYEADKKTGKRNLLLLARKVSGGAVLEFVSTTGKGKNLQDQVALLSEQAEEGLLEKEISLRLLRHLAASVRHQQYHGADIMTVRVDLPKPTAQYTV
ncbi:MAG: hypothetical protein F4069_06920 [Rhodothermaceae bacterium]|nr:hypothetical protein [Rhodothermaceae bacterium]MYG70125.1 hypothetical protein [Rhodothermaceae bacterium]MYJ45043.1 hypothetical protein [Rhodothermaceae bacterium]